MEQKRLDKAFFERDCLEVAPELVGKIVARKVDGEIIRVRIAETEAYRGEEDTACHAHRGRTPRTEALYRESATAYIYLCYGIHWLMNVITGEVGEPQGVLFRAGVGINGPARLTKVLQIDKSLNLANFTDSDELWIEDDGKRFEILTDKRVGINYASQEDIDRLWRFKIGAEL